MFICLFVGLFVSNNLQNCCTKLKKMFTIINFPNAPKYTRKNKFYNYEKRTLEVQDYLYFKKRTMENNCGTSLSTTYL